MCTQYTTCTVRFGSSWASQALLGTLKQPQCAMHLYHSPDGNIVIARLVEFSEDLRSLNCGALDTPSTQNILKSSAMCKHIIRSAMCKHILRSIGI